MSGKPAAVPTDRKAKGTGASFVFEALRRDILDLAIEPGAVLDESQLSQRFGVSRSPVREALVRLSATGLVEALPNRSTVVARLPIGGLAPFLEAQEVLYRLTAREAAKRATPEDVQALEVLQDRLEALSAEGRSGEMVGVNREFHLTVARIAANAWFEGWLHSLMDEGQRILRLYMRVLGDQVPLAELRRHREIIQALRERDVEMADLAGRRDADIVRAQLVALVSRNGMTEVKFG